MKTAVLYAGQARTISQTYENHAWHLRHFPEPSIFCSVADDAQAADMFLLRDEAFPGSPFHLEKVVQPPVELWPEKTIFHSGYPRSTGQEGVLKQLWAWNRAWTFFTTWANPAEFDIVIRIRPDIAFLRLEPPPVETITPSTCLTPRWAKWGGQNDRFAILGRTAAESYFTLWQNLPALKHQHCPCHPEQLLDASLRMNGITPSPTLKAEFITVRMPSAENPNGGYYPCDMTVVDLADCCTDAADV